MPTKEFLLWRNTVAVELIQVNELLKKELSDDFNQLEGQLKKIESWNFRLLVLYVEAGKFLKDARYSNLVPKDRAYSEMDREIQLDFDTKEEAGIFDTLQGLIGTKHSEGMISRRISLGQSLLANHRKIHGKM